MAPCKPVSGPAGCFLRFLLLTGLLFVPSAQADNPPIVPSLIPLPATMQVGSGAFIVDSHSLIAADGDATKRTAELFNGYLAQAGRAPLRIIDSRVAPTPAAAIRFELTPAAGPAPEGYALAIDSDGIRLRAGDTAGLFHGATTLWQLLTQVDGDRVVLPQLRIEDAPRFRWRGYMLDSARQFHSVAQVKQILDAMALHKLNVFHWHLTDDQGWRIQIKRYPKLTEVGGCRIPVGDDGIDPDSGKPRRQCGWYNQDDIRAIVAYAAARHIEVVPEIDVPGHATAAIAAYPWLGSLGRPIAVTSDRGIHANLFNVEERTFRFLDEVFAEVAALFPGRYIHVGGDEAIKDQWKASPRVQARLRALDLKDEAALQGWFMRRLEQILVAHGKQLIGWDEILEGGLPAEATVMSWRGVEGGIAAARQGHDVVMSPVSAVYFDYLQTDAPDEFPGRPAPRLLPMRKVYDFEPLPAELDAAKRRHILGLQANMWTTDNRSFAGVMHNTFPRLLAVAETGWTPRARKDYASFLQRLPAWNRRYQALGIAAARTPFEVIADIVPAARAGQARITLHNPLGYPIRYSANGSAPGPASALYAQPLELPLPVQLQAAAFAADGALAPARRYDIDAASLLTRSDEQLQPCSSGGPVLRLEDDGPAQGPRALFNVNILQPCWRWPDAPLQGIASIEVRAGRLPYWINQSASEDATRKYLPARSAHGELDVRVDSCEGETIASAPMPAQPDADGFVVLRAAVDHRFDAPRTLCIRFSGNTRPAMWVLDRATLSPEPSGN